MDVNEGMWSGLSLNQVGPRPSINIHQNWMRTFANFRAMQSRSKAMSDCIKPRTNVSIFGSLEGMAGDWVHMPWLDFCILSRWSPSLCFNVSHEMLKNMGRPGYEASPIIVFGLCIFLTIADNKLESNVVIPNLL